jgi:DNA-nicking Smr family endonuclease
MRRLSPDEEALWARVIDSVRPLHGERPPSPKAPPAAPPARPVAWPARTPAGRRGPGQTLDGGWDRRLIRGAVQPDATLDLHGHDLATAYHLLDRGLAAAIAGGARVLLLVTGNPPGPERPVKRGAIRAAVGDWLAASRHAGDIAAVRAAHPRHGGAGALYIILRRRR